MRKVLSLLYFPFKLIIIVVFSPILTVLYWAAVITLVIPLYVFRKLLGFTARLLDPDICKIVTSIGHLISRDYEDWYRSPSQTVTVILKLKGAPTLQEIRQLFTKNLVHKSDLNRNQLEYPELQQYFTKRLGYLFFKWDRNFDISKHVNLYTNKVLLPNPETDVVNEATLIRIWETVMTKPLLEKRSPWEVYLVPNYKNDFEEKQTAVIFRVHHGLCDGASIHKLLLAITDNGLDDLENDLYVFRKVPVCTNFLVHLRAFFCGPTSVVCKFAKGFDLFNPLHRPLGKKAGQGYIVKTTFDLETIKRITRVHLDVSFQAVLIAAVSGAIRNYMLGKGAKIPMSPVRLGMPTPRLGHTYKLRNEFLIKVVDLPVHKKTPRQRLLEVERRLTAKDSFMPFMGQSWQTFGLLPAKLLRILSSKSAITVNYSEIKGPTRILTVAGGKYEMLDLVFSIGLGTDDSGLACTVISYNRKIHIMLTMDRGIGTRDSAQHLLNLVEKELKELEYGDSTNL